MVLNRGLECEKKGIRHFRCPKRRCGGKFQAFEANTRTWDCHCEKCGLPLQIKSKVYDPNDSKKECISVPGGTSGYTKASIKRGDYNVLFIEHGKGFTRKPKMRFLWGKHLTTKNIRVGKLSRSCQVHLPVKKLIQVHY
jgi:hypothetical protein